MITKAAPIQHLPVRVLELIDDVLRAQKSSVLLEFEQRDRRVHMRVESQDTGLREEWIFDCSDVGCRDVTGSAMVACACNEGVEDLLNELDCFHE